MKINRFDNIESWKRSRKLVNLVYFRTNEYPFHKDFGLRDQIRRASVSSLSIIAEEFDNGTNKSFFNF